MLATIGRSAAVAAALYLAITSPTKAIENEASTELIRTSAQPQAEEATAATTKPVLVKRYAKRKKNVSRSKSKVAARIEKPVADPKPAAPLQADAVSDQPRPAGQRTQVASASVFPDATSPALPPAVANANAQWMTSPRNAADIAARTMTIQANDSLRSVQNDVADASAAATLPDHNRDSGNPDQPAERKLTMASLQLAKPVAAAITTPQEQRSAPQVVAQASFDASAWTQTSLIGKIFIAFGGLLTLASAARMFFA